METISSIVAVVFLVVCTSVLGAQEASLTDAVNWLETNQDVSGLWSVEKATPFRDASVVLEVLSAVDGDSAVVADGLSAVVAINTTSSDFLARKIIAMAACSGGVVFPSLVDGLAARQDSDGGWGYGEGYGSNVLEAALALKALKAVSYSNMPKLGNGVAYLTANENADGGWSFVAADSSQVFFTSHVLISLYALQGDFNVSTQIEDGANWLKAHARADGGFGTGDASNPYETGLAMAALIKGDATATQIDDARAYLEATQLADGSWNSDAYSTAMAVYGLNHMAPDLAILASDVAFSNPAPVDSDHVVISATVRNLGMQDAESVLVRVLDGLPDERGGQIGDDTVIASLTVGGSSLVEVSWDTYGLAGDHAICVVVDPLNRIREAELLNNIAQKSIHVSFPPDLMIAEDGIVFDPPDPDTLDVVVISTTVKNQGEVDATDVSLQIWDGNPHMGGVALLDPPYNITSIPPDGQFTLNLNMGNYFNTQGEYPIYACADVDYAIREISEFNNCNCETLQVGIQSRSIAMEPGLNLLGHPLEPVEEPTSYTMIPLIPTCNEIHGWDRISQMWISAIDIGGVIIGDEFPLELRDGFFARVTEGGPAPLYGRPVGEHGCTHLETGLNMVSIPNEDACYTAYTMIDDINTCDEAHRWDGSLQMWESAVKIAPDVFIGEDFPVRPGNGYFVKVGSAGDWCTHTCDTIAVLPDLLVRPEDILFDPEPAISGQPVGLYVNINNIGLETAYSPRLDIYFGDPDGEGQLLMWGYLPVDIPPGGSSGYYGNPVTFEGQGFADIYGVADINNEIEELDETNNKAFRWLEVVLPAITRSGEGSTGEVAVLSGGSSVPHLEFNPDLEPSPVQMGHSIALLDDQPTDEDLPSGDPEHVITSIEEITVGNHSSRSVAISWITDGVAQGCVDYGPTPDLGLTKCEAGHAGETHMVVLGDLAESTSYYFEVISGSAHDDNDGSYHSFSTARNGAGVPSIIFGLVTAPNGVGLGDVLVSGRLVRDGDGSMLLTALTDPDGMWMLNLGNLKDQAEYEVWPHEAGDNLVLEIRGGSLGAGMESVLISGRSPQNCGTCVLEVPADVVGPAEDVPRSHYLSSNSPNPFNARTEIGFGLPVPGHVELSIYDICGKKVVTILDEDKEAGNHLVIWDGTNSAGRTVSPGIYFYRMETGGFAQIRKMLLVR